MSPRVVATATLYTPYQPNAASLASYPGTGGTACARSSYGNYLGHRSGDRITAN